jgi:hypothetical protein
MTPEAALEIQIERYRAMSPAERVELALRLHELASEVARSGIRAQHPDATAEEWRRCCARDVASRTSLCRSVKTDSKS